MAKAKKQKDELVANSSQIDEKSLFLRVSEIIEKRKARAGSYVNQEVTLMYWEIGKFINQTMLAGERAEYGKQIVATLSQQLTEKYGKSFDYTNIRRMMQFSIRFPNIEIVAPLAQQLNWSILLKYYP